MPATLPPATSSAEAEEQRDEPILKPLQLDPETILSQLESPLFSVLPAEIRTRIFEHALAPYPDPDTRYDAATPYARPSHVARPLQSTTLLQTCRLVYAEAWFHPWTTGTQTFYLGHQARRPSHPTSTPIILQPALDTLHALHPDGPVELSNIQVFAQLYALEAGDLKHILKMEHFHPKTITLTLRHTDWWYWEDDAPLRIDSRWVGICDGLWPESVREVHIELESLERRHDQINDVALQMAETWVFRRRDGVVLAIEGYVKQRPEEGTSEAKEEDDEATTPSLSIPRKPTPGTPSHWTGSSTFNGARWLRDEPVNHPGTLDYYIRTLTFRPVPCTATIPDHESSSQYPAYPPPIETRIGAPLHSDPTTAPSAYEEAWELDWAGCDDNMEAAEVRSRLEIWRHAQWEDAQTAADEERFRAIRSELRAGQSVLDREIRGPSVADGGEYEFQAGPVAQGGPIGPRRPGRRGPARGRLAGGPPL